jgi:phosphatidylglycerol---prolipoprotein diacylglyceryl transferase
MFVVGKVGCFLGGCCYGTPLGLDARADSGITSLLICRQAYAAHPVQLYEAGAFLVILGGALRRWAHPRADGRNWPRLLTWFGVIHFLAEFLRADRVVTTLGLSTGQLACVLIAVFAATCRVVAMKHSERRTSMRSRLVATADGAAT